MRQQRPHALEITRRRSSPAAGQHTEATRRTPSREVRQIQVSCPSVGGNECPLTDVTRPRRGAARQFRRNTGCSVYFFRFSRTASAYVSVECGHPGISPALLRLCHSLPGT
ncbi:MAG: hypothetical protein EOO27_12530 [Comamonadaceae bacterium]|nr:MAG: hypothetical protein EOO27_12530 [Comamonadaceae bacterium]